MGDERSDAVGFGVDLDVGETEDGVAELVEVEVTGLVILEGDRAPVIEVGVGFDHELLLAPEEVDLVAAQLDIGLSEREGRTMPVNEGIEVFL